MIRRVDLLAVRRRSTPEGWAALVAAHTQGRLGRPVVTPMLMKWSYDDRDPELAALRAELAPLKQAGLVVSEAPSVEWEAADLAASDLVQVLGVAVDTDARPFVVAEDVGPPQRCPTCGGADPWERTMADPLRCDPALLSGPAVLDGRTFAPVPGGWDVVNLPDGGLAVSDRAVAALAGARGWRTGRMADTAGRPVAMTRLLAERSVLVPISDPGAVCPTCGLVLRPVPEPWAFAAADVEGVDLFSRHRNHAAELWIRRATVDALEAAGLRGLVPVKGASLR